MVWMSAKTLESSVISFELLPLQQSDFASHSLSFRFLAASCPEPWWFALDFWRPCQWGSITPKGCRLVDLNSPDITEDLNAGRVHLLDDLRSFISFRKVHVPPDHISEVLTRGYLRLLKTIDEWCWWLVRFIKTYMSLAKIQFPLIRWNYCIYRQIILLDFQTEPGVEGDQAHILCGRNSFNIGVSNVVDSPHRPPKKKAQYSVIPDSCLHLSSFTGMSSRSSLGSTKIPVVSTTNPGAESSWDKTKWFPWPRHEERMISGHCLFSSRSPA